jgi:hypothetical protein
LQPGDAAELAFVAELERLGYAAWATGGTMDVKTLPGGRRIPIRKGNDILGLFDVLGVSEAGVVLAQVKSGQHYRAPEHLWTLRYMALPKPANLWCLWAWWEGWTTWRVERLLPGGERQRIAWPPEQQRAAS